VEAENYHASMSLSMGCAPLAGIQYRQQSRPFSARNIDRPHAIDPRILEQAKIRLVDIASSCRPDFPVTYQGADQPQARRRSPSDGGTNSPLRRVTRCPGASTIALHKLRRPHFGFGVFSFVLGSPRLSGNLQGADERQARWQRTSDVGIWH
jgi:hypothetical protein